MKLRSFWNRWVVFASFSTLATLPVAGQQDAGGGPVFKSESRLVLVDAVVADKKGNYIHDLTQKDFKVFEDNNEQEIKSFSFQADPKSPLNGKKQYMVLFFDNSSMQMGDQMVARKAATQFIDTNAGPQRYMAIVNFGGSMKVVQNFTADAERLKKVAQGISIPQMGINNGTGLEGTGVLGGLEDDLTARSEVLAIRALARGMAGIPGRKILVFLSAGFPVTQTLLSEISAAVDACNKANVAIYPIDVRGLVAAEAHDPASQILLASRDAQSTGALIASLLSAQWFQHGGGGGGGVGGGGGHSGGGSTGGGSTGGGSTGGSHGSTGGTGSGSGGSHSGGGGSTPTNPGPGIYNPNANNPLFNPRNLLTLPDTFTNQSVMHMLADGTGGFMIYNTNDLLGALQKIAAEQNEYYLMGYTPPDPTDGACHTLKVKVSRPGVVVRARSGYCNVKPVDLLSGKPAEKELEARVSGSAPGSVKATMSTPYFYSSPNTARVDVAIELPGDALEFVKQKGKLHMAMNVLGIAYKTDGTVAARFSDTLDLDAQDKKAAQNFQTQPLHYEDQFDIAPGKYTLKVVFKSGEESFGKLEAPLNVDPYDGKTMAMSGVALSQNVKPVGQLDAAQDEALLQGKTSLIAQGMQIVPTGTSQFKKGSTVVAYLEVYDPSLADAKPPGVGVRLRVLDRKTGEQKEDSGLVNMAKAIQPGNAMIPVGLRLPTDKLAAGAYRLELSAADTAGHKAGVRSTDFDLE
jgi:VWFA-related protein